jgi:hypothetical protein
LIVELTTAGPVGTARGVEFEAEGWSVEKQFGGAGGAKAPALEESARAATVTSAESDIDSPFVRTLTTA